ncbi:MAG: SH3 domain-containing protein [Candidatus Omnitrophica bacterium]|nr:SH3 domain-containing protein [Candidatus Omnitrophota bacterium]
MILRRAVAKPRTVIVSFGLIFTISSFRVLGASDDLPLLPKGPLILTSITEEQLSPEYWIAHLPHADQVLKTRQEIEKFNQEIRQMVPEQKDVFKIGEIMRGVDIQAAVQHAYETIENRKLFDEYGKVIPKDFFGREIKPLLGLESSPVRVKVKWGAAVRETSVRALPTTVKMIEGADDVEFDQLQFTLIKLWTPVAVYHTSSDGNWYYIQAPYVRGWVMSKNIALFPNQRALQERAESKSFLVATGESALICSDSGCSAELQRASMGTVVPLLGDASDAYVVSMPFRGVDGNVNLGKGYVTKTSDVENQFPSFTQANVIRQAFKLLGARYGWGGMYKGRDCSGFTQDVFLSLGVDMPRDSKQQAMVGTPLGSFEPFEGAAQKVGILENMATPAITLLRMPLHLMLYLGEVDGKHYVIHSTWAERIGQDPVKDEKRRINQVVVSDLSLNGNSYLGDLFDRTVQINEVN